MKRIAIFGATSAIAQAVARLYAQEGARFFLVARNEQRLQAVAQDLRVRGASAVVIAAADLANLNEHGVLMERARTALESIDLVLVAHGTLGEHERSIRDAALAVQEASINFLSPLSLLTHVANLLETQGHGTIAAICSVAGDRGRRGNYVYGSAKAGLATFVSGLRHRFAAQAIRVVLIKPGLVDTPMTAGLAKGGPLWATSERVARDIRRGIERGSEVVYTPWFWRWIMAIIRALPDAIFKRLSI